MEIDEARKIYHQYEIELSNIDHQIKVHKPPYWWETSKEAVFLSLDRDRNTIGFAIVGYGKFIDPDVKSEICEIYLYPAHRNIVVLRKLLKKASPYLKSPWGFQVLKTNRRAISLFEYLLKKHGKSYTKKLSLDGIVTVYKYRVLEKFL